MSNEEKNSPPRKPVPSERTDANALSNNSTATSRSGRSTTEAKRSAPWPEDRI